MLCGFTTMALRYMTHDSNNYRYLLSSIFISSIVDNLQANEFYEQKAKNKSVHLQYWYFWNTLTKGNSKS